MPYGYVEYRLKRGISENTLKLQAIVIEQFFSYLRYKYEGKEPDIKQITEKDVRDFLDQQYIEKEFDKATVYRKQSNLKKFFDFLWETKQIDYDILAKFKYFPDDVVIKSNTTNPIEYTYEILLEKKKLVLNSKLPFTSKLLMVLYTKGIQLNDMYHLQVKDFLELPGNKIGLTYVSSLGFDAEMLFENEKDIEVIKKAIKIANERKVPYIISYKNGETKKYQQSQPMLSRYYVLQIADLIGMNVSSNEMRIVYVNYLFHNENMTHEQIAEMLGRSKENIKKLVREGIARIHPKEYNQQLELALQC